MKLLISIIIGYLVCVYSPLGGMINIYPIDIFVPYEPHQIFAVIALITIIYSITMKITTKKSSNFRYSKLFITLVCISTMGIFASYFILYRLDFVTFSNPCYFVVPCLETLDFTGIIKKLCFVSCLPYYMILWAVIKLIRENPRECFICFSVHEVSVATQFMICEEGIGGIVPQQAKA